MLKARMTKAGAVILAALSIMALGAVAAFATADTAAVSAVGDSAGDLKDTLVAVALVVLPYAAAILAITVGWRLAKRFVR